jgi:hypothetical protein
MTTRIYLICFFFLSYGGADASPVGVRVQPYPADTAKKIVDIAVGTNGLLKGLNTTCIPEAFILCMTTNW